MSQYCRKFENCKRHVVLALHLSLFEISYFHLVLSLKMSGTVSPQLHMPSQSSHIELYFTLYVEACKCNSDKSGK
jgi:hypothetical protein